MFTFLKSINLERNNSVYLEDNISPLLLICDFGTNKTRRKWWNGFLFSVVKNETKVRFNLMSKGIYKAQEITFCYNLVQWRNQAIVTTAEMQTNYC